MDFERIKLDVVGRWPGIFRALGIAIRDDGRHSPCPKCGGEDRFRFDNKEDRGTWFCNNCGAGDGWDLVQNALECDFKSAAEQIAPLVGNITTCKYTKEQTVSPETLRKLFLGSKPAEKTNLVGQYLAGRGLKCCPDTLRYHPNCYEPESKKDHPAMLAIVRLPDKTAVTIHRTYLDVETGGKAKLDSPKKLMPGLKKLTGGAIRLFEPENGVIGIAEGIETAIACYQRFFIPTWAAVSSTLLESFSPPMGIRKVYVFGDNDKNYAGQAAAYSLAKRLVLTEKIPTEVMIPFQVGDWLDHIND